MKKTIRRILFYVVITLMLGYYIAAGKYQYERAANLSYQLLDKKISKVEHSRLKKQNTLMNALQHPLIVLGIDEVFIF